jgi:hypothetical protein
LLVFIISPFVLLWRKLLAGGGFSAVEPWDEGDFTLAFVSDPDGVWIELLGKKLKSTKRTKKHTNSQKRKRR